MRGEAAWGVVAFGGGSRVELVLVTTEALRGRVPAVVRRSRGPPRALRDQSPVRQPAPTTTGLAVRTTHLTGPSTDLGIHLGAACLATGAERRAALRGAALRGGKVVAFMLGAGLALPLAGAFGFLALLAPAAFVLAAVALSFVPAWSPSDYPFRAGDGPARAAGTPAGSVAGVR